MSGLTPDPIPLVDLRAQYSLIQAEVVGAIERVLGSGRFVSRPEVGRFESAFVDFCEVAGVGPGDEVVTVAHTFVATVAAIRYTGATPVLVDVEPATYTMDPTALAAGITSRTRAVLPVDLYGACADLTAIEAVARSHGVPVIEDACQAHGARHAGQRAGSFGEMACFSFYPGKNLGAYGEGGAMVTDDEDLAHRARALRDHGQDRKYHHSVVGFNYGWTNCRAPSSMPNCDTAMSGTPPAAATRLGTPNCCPGRTLTSWPNARG